MTQKLPFIEVDPPHGVRADASVIWLHGLGASGHDFLPVAQHLSLLYPNLRFVLPHAPMRAVSANQGLRMRAWYDLYSWNFREHEDLIGLQTMASQMDALIEEEEARGIPSDRIVLAGFSQGGAMALYTGLRHAKRLAAIIALSTYVPDPNSTAWTPSSSTIQPSFTTPASPPTSPSFATPPSSFPPPPSFPRKRESSLPIFLAHGQFDAVIPIAMALEARQILEKGGCSVEWHDYAMEHTVVEEEIQAIADFLGRVLSTLTIE